MSTSTSIVHRHDLVVSWRLLFAGGVGLRDLGLGRLVSQARDSQRWGDHKGRLGISWALNSWRNVKYRGLCGVDTVVRIQ